MMHTQKKHTQNNTTMKQFDSRQGADMDHPTMAHATLPPPAQQTNMQTLQANHAERFFVLFELPQGRSHCLSAEPPRDCSLTTTTHKTMQQTSPRPPPNCAHDCPSEIRVVISHTSGLRHLATPGCAFREPKLDILNGKLTILCGASAVAPGCVSRFSYTQAPNNLGLYLPPPHPHRITHRYP